MELFESRGIPWIVIGRGNGMEGIPASRNFTNRTSLRETCALLKSSSLLITGDSGPMHLAGAVGTPVWRCLGPRRKNGAFSRRGRRIGFLSRSWIGRPCTLHGKKHCDRNHACMQSITPEQVMRALDE